MLSHSTGLHRTTSVRQERGRDDKAERKTRDCAEMGHLKDK